MLTSLMIHTHTLKLSSAWAAAKANQSPLYIREQLSPPVIAARVSSELEIKFSIRRESHYHNSLLIKLLEKVEPIETYDRNSIKYSLKTHKKNIKIVL